MNVNSHAFRTKYQTFKDQTRMKKLFEQIDSLCRRATIPVICQQLNIRRDPSGVTYYHVLLGNAEANLPDESHQNWRRVWRAFLTDHADEIAKNLDAASAVAPDEQSCSTAERPAASAQKVLNSQPTVPSYEAVVAALGRAIEIYRYASMTRWERECHEQTMEEVEKVHAEASVAEKRPGGAEPKP
jgi:hypothetical protein